MTDERWIVIPNWAEFQHYKNRDPSWIKAYTRLLSDDAWMSLTHHQRGILLGLWLIYARSDGQIRGSTVTVTRQLGGDTGQRVTTRDLEALNHAGLIHFSASKPLALRYQAASPEKRREEEPLGSSSSHVTGARATSAIAGRTQTNGAGQHRPAYDIALDRVRNIGAEIPTTHLDAELRDALDQRYDELTSDQLVELRDLHAELAGG